MDQILAIDALVSTFGARHLFSTGSYGCQEQHTEWRAVQEQVALVNLSVKDVIGALLE